MVIVVWTFSFANANKLLNRTLLEALESVDFRISSIMEVFKKRYHLVKLKQQLFYHLRISMHLKKLYLILQMRFAMSTL